MSPWLVAVIGVTFVLCVALLLIEHGYRGGDPTQAIQAWRTAMIHGRLTAKDLIFAATAQAALLWVTFLSNGRFVTEGDKCAVRWMMTGAALAYLIMAVRYLLKLL